MTAGWTLENVVEAARLNPRSFFIPSEDERLSMRPGDSVRLHFLLGNPKSDEPRAERMWVTIVDSKGDPPRYRGSLQNQPQYVSGLEPGHEIQFGPEHIARILIEESDPLWFAASEKRAAVSAAVFEPDECVRWMYRETPDRDQDSGWRLYTGTESTEYLERASNIRICNVGWLTDFDPTLLPAIRAEIGAAFERSSIKDNWKEVKDWVPPED